MGQKVNPYSFRLPQLYDWQSRWLAEGEDYQQLFLEDVRLRKFLMKRLRSAGIARVQIERSARAVKVIIYVSRPGVVIGRGGSRLEELKKEINCLLGKKKKQLKIEVEIREVEVPDLDAQLILDNLVSQLERGAHHRWLVNKVIDRVMNAGAKGVKVVFSGRIGGTEIGRMEKYKRGTIPLQTLRADIDYAEGPALGKNGYIGIKVWIYKQEKEV